MTTTQNGCKIGRFIEKEISNKNTGLVRPGANVVKLFMAVLARLFVPGKILQPSLMFASKVRRLP